MTTKELRELARTTLAEQLRAEKVDPDRVNAAIQVLNTPLVYEPPETGTMHAAEGRFDINLGEVFARDRTS